MEPHALYSQWGAAIAEMVERDKQMPDSMRSVAARIRILIQQRGVK